jgi:uncharacterized protein YfiM (DUF2279 family)
MHRLWLVFSLGPAALPSDNWFAGDKLQHFFTSAFVQSMSYGSLRTAGLGHGPALAGATAVSAVAGVGKEVYDLRTKGDFSLRDLTWDAAGAGAATVLLARTRR